MKNRRTKDKFDSFIKLSWYKPDEQFEFVSVSYQRRIGLQHVNKIVKRLEEQELTEGFPILIEPMVVNVRSKGKVALLDGYHRYEALKRYNKPVMLKLEVYRGLDKLEEKLIYEKYNIGKKHTVLDLVRARMTELPVLRRLIKRSEIPLILYTNRAKGMPLTSFTGAYLRAKYFNKSSRHRPTSYDFAVGLTENDVEKLLSFASWYVSVRGAYNSKSNSYKTTFFAGMMYCYFRTMRPDALTVRARDLKIDSYILELAKSSGFIAMALVVADLKKKLNKGLVRPIID